MARQLAVSTQLKNALAKIEELEKKLKSVTDDKDRWYKMQTEKNEEIEQVHALLDALPGAAGRQSQAEEPWQRKTLSLMTRLAAYLASRGVPN